jgi:integrase
MQAAAVGRDPAAEKQAGLRAARDCAPDQDTVTAVSGHFLHRHTRANNRKQSVDAVERTFRKIVVPAWGTRRIQEISRRDVIHMLDTIVDRGTPILANRTLAHIRRFFNWALDRSIIDASPCVRIHAPAIEKSRDRVLSDDELRLVWKGANELGSPFGPFVQLLILTMQRRDEVAGMRRSEIKDGADVWTIGADRTKSGSIQDVPLSASAESILGALPRLAGSGRSRAYLGEGLANPNDSFEGSPGTGHSAFGQLRLFNRTQPKVRVAS